MPRDVRVDEGRVVRRAGREVVGSGPDAVAYVEARVGGEVRWGAGRDASVLTAGVRAVLSAVGRARGVEPSARRSVRGWACGAGRTGLSARG
ncbi:hypothetical protein AB0C76_00095 [Kitasatospora sp. NPDC048722]|uniref:hypothetical protein n=1 Tax=Kitasatospora sp. NPDC048722 TaxID=3155639 RepID=UPI003401E70B